MLCCHAVVATVVSTNAALLARDRVHLVHPLHDLKLHESGHVWVKGEGAILTDADGHQVIDGLAGLWNVTAGHGRTELAEAMRRQAETLGYVSGYSGSSNPRAVELAERLAAICYPSINHFFFTSGGGEATESSIKLTRAYWKFRGQPDKTKVISRIEGYHGVTLAAMSATGMSPYWSLFEPRVPGFVHIPSPYPYRYVAPDGVSQGIAAANELEQAILREGPETVGMFIAEPVQGAGGVILPPDDYFPRIREICDQYDVLFVADEVITGFGRTGKLFALDHWRSTSIVQFAKAITSRLLSSWRDRHRRQGHADDQRGRPPLDARLHLQRTSRGVRRRAPHARHHRGGTVPGTGSPKGSAPPRRTPRCVGRPFPRWEHSRQGTDVCHRVRARQGDEGLVRGAGKGRPPHSASGYRARVIQPGQGRHLPPRTPAHHHQQTARPGCGDPDRRGRHRPRMIRRVVPRRGVRT